MGRKIKPLAATHYVKKTSFYGEEIIYIKDNGFCWGYWNDIFFDWYRYDYSYGEPIKL